MNRRPERLSDLLPGVIADLAATHTAVNGEPPMTNPPHSGCRDLLVTRMREMGTEVVASMARPLIRTPYTTEGFVCPHGTTFWLEPTTDQIAEWARDGVA